MTESLLKLCAHRALDGTECKAPALRRADYCRHHIRVHRNSVGLPPYVYAAGTHPELVAALRRTLHDLFTGRIAPRLGCQILFELDQRIRALKPRFQGGNVEVVTSNKKGPTSRQAQSVTDPQL